MTILVSISQFILYVCFALLFGYWILQLVPTPYKPAIEVPEKYIKMSVLSIIIGAFIPVLYIMLLLAPSQGWGDTIVKVLFTFDLGIAWSATCILGVLLLLATFILKKRMQAIVGLLFASLLVITVAWSSHAAGMNVTGFISDAIHLFAVSIWVGILLIVSWFSVSMDNWAAFLKWFSITAFICFVMTVLSGLFLLDVMVPSYSNSWISSYGTGLFLKHLFLIPLVLYALMNGVIVKWMMYKHVDFNPKPWVRLESIILFIIFGLTALFSQQSPPTATIMQNQVSALFEWVIGKSYETGMGVQLAPHIMSYVMFILLLLFVALLIVAYIKQAAKIVSFLLSVFIVVCVYVLIMSSITIA